MCVGTRVPRYKLSPEPGEGGLRQAQAAKGTLVVDKKRALNMVQRPDSVVLC
jgi:hypothetical protein